MPDKPYIKPHSLVDLDDDVIEHSGLFLNSTKDLNALSGTCRLSYGFFNKVVQKRGATELLELVLRGEAGLAMQLIAKAPHLLFIKSQAQDFALGFESQRRTVVGSPFQAILGAADISLIKWLQQQSFFNDYQEQVREQFDEQFPRAAEDIYSDYDENTVSHILNGLVKAIDNDPCFAGKLNPITESALKAFRDYFAPKEVSTGLHFDLQALTKTFEVYNANCERWYNMSNTDDRSRVFWIRVVGYLERMLSTVDAQAFCAGLGVVVKANAINLVHRTLKLDGVLDFFPCDVGGEYGLGISFAVYSNFGGERAYVVGSGVQNVGVILSWWEQKQQALAGLRSETAPQKHLGKS